MFEQTEKAIHAAKARERALADFEELRIAELTVAEFRQLMAQIAWDEESRRSPLASPRPQTPIRAAQQGLKGE